MPSFWISTAELPTQESLCPGRAPPGLTVAPALVWRGTDFRVHAPYQFNPCLSQDHRHHLAPKHGHRSGFNSDDSQTVSSVENDQPRGEDRDDSDDSPIILPLTSLCPAHLQRPQKPHQDSHEGCLAWVLQNLPSRVVPEKFLLEVARLGFQGLYEFFHMPLHSKKSNKGYAFIGFADPVTAGRFRLAAYQMNFNKSCGSRELEVKPAELQSLEEMQERFGKVRPSKYVHFAVRGGNSFW